MSPSPIVRFRVLYLGASLPTLSKEGLLGIQEPLKELLRNSTSSQVINNNDDFSANRSGDDAKQDSSPPIPQGIDCWFSVWSNGLLLEYVQQPPKGTPPKIFHPIQTLHFCAAVKFHGLLTAENSSFTPKTTLQNNSIPLNPTTTTPPTKSSLSKLERAIVEKYQFLPVDSPILGGSKTIIHNQTSNQNGSAFNKPATAIKGCPNRHGGYPPIFACTVRRTHGVRVLECHAFLCKTDDIAFDLCLNSKNAYIENLKLFGIPSDSGGITENAVDSTPKPENIVDSTKTTLSGIFDSITTSNKISNTTTIAGPPLPPRGIITDNNPSCIGGNLPIFTTQKQLQHNGSIGSPPAVSRMASLSSPLNLSPAQQMKLAAEKIEKELEFEIKSERSSNFTNGGYSPSSNILIDKNGEGGQGTTVIDDNFKLVSTPTTTPKGILEASFYHQKHHYAPASSSINLFPDFLPINLSPGRTNDTDRSTTTFYDSSPISNSSHYQLQQQDHYHEPSPPGLTRYPFREPHGPLFHHSGDNNQLYPPVFSNDRNNHLIGSDPTYSPRPLLRDGRCVFPLSPGFTPGGPPFQGPPYPSSASMMDHFGFMSLRYPPTNISSPYILLRGPEDLKAVAEPYNGIHDNSFLTRTKKLYRPPPLVSKFGTATEYRRNAKGGGGLFKRKSLFYPSSGPKGLERTSTFYGGMNPPLPLSSSPNFQSYANEYDRNRSGRSDNAFKFKSWSDSLDANLMYFNHDHKLPFENHLAAAKYQAREFPIGGTRNPAWPVADPFNREKHYQFNLPTMGDARGLAFEDIYDKSHHQILTTTTDKKKANKKATVDKTAAVRSGSSGGGASSSHSSLDCYGFPAPDHSTSRKSSNALSKFFSKKTTNKSSKVAATNGLNHGYSSGEPVYIPSNFIAIRMKNNQQQQAMVGGEELNYEGEVEGGRFEDPRSENKSSSSSVFRMIRRSTVAAKVPDKILINNNSVVGGSQPKGHVNGPSSNYERQQSAEQLVETAAGPPPPNCTGIYRKQMRLNEKSFAFSIREGITSHYDMYGSLPRLGNESYNFVTVGGPASQQQQHGGTPPPSCLGVSSTTTFSAQIKRESLLIRARAAPPEPVIDYNSPVKTTHNQLPPPQAPPLPPVPHGPLKLRRQPEKSSLNGGKMFYVNGCNGGTNSSHDNNNLLHMKNQKFPNIENGFSTNQLDSNSPKGAKVNPNTTKFNFYGGKQVKDVTSTHFRNNNQPRANYETSIGAIHF